MATLDTWLEQGVMEVLVEGLYDVDEVLKTVLDKHRDFHWESQSMKEKVFLSE